MLLPFDTTIGLWLKAMPRFEWEAEPAPLQTSEADGPAGNAPAAANDAASEQANLAAGAAPSGIVCLPAMRLVFKGYHWVAMPTWGLRENTGFEQVAQLQRDEDQRHIDERGRQARRRPTPDAK